MLKIYVAGSSNERARYREAVHGLDVTFDWEAGFTSYERELRDGNVKRAGCIYRNAATSCLDGVNDCDVFILLVPTTPSRGVWLETGIAIEACKILLAVGDDSKLDIWGTCFDARFDTMEECLAHIGVK